MKTNIATTKDQSQRLLRCGVSADTADMFYQTPITVSQKAKREDILLVRKADEPLFDTDTPAWSLSALLTKVLPGKIDFRGGPCLLEIVSSNWQSDEQIWEVAYDIELGVEASDPIEACVLMAEKLTANGYKLNET